MLDPHLSAHVNEGSKPSVFVVGTRVVVVEGVGRHAPHAVPQPLQTKALCSVINNMSNNVITSFTKTLPYTASIHDFPPNLGLDQALVVRGCGSAGTVPFSQFIFKDDCMNVRVIL